MALSNGINYGFNTERINFHRARILDAGVVCIQHNISADAAKRNLHAGLGIDRRAVHRRGIAVDRRRHSVALWSK